MPALDQEALLERETELGQLHEALDRAAAGTGGALLVEGPAGIGKTRLLEAVGDSAERSGVQVLRARGAELEREFAFGVVRQLVEPRLQEGTPADRQELLAGAAGLAVQAVGPEPPSAQPGNPSFGALHGLYWFVANLAESSPVLLLIDDAQWADESSLKFAAFAAPRLAELPVLLAMAMREGEGAAQTDLVHRIAADAAVSTLRPEPLSEEAVAAVISAELGTPPAPEFASACHTAVRGNPLLLREFVDELRREGIEPTAEQAGRIGAVGPRAVSRTVLVRLGGLGPAAAALAQAVAVLGDGAEFRHAAALAQVDPDAAASATDELVRASIFRPGRELAFVHPVVRLAVYGRLAPRRRADAHAQAARLLTSESAPVERVAAHLLATDGIGDADVVATLRRAAAAALGRGAPEAAIVHLRRAVDEPPPLGDRAAVLMELGTAEARARDANAVEHLAEAHALAADAQERGRIAVELGRSLLMSGRVQNAIELFERAIADLGESRGELPTRLETELIAAARLDIGRRAAAAARLARIAEGLKGDRPGERPVLANVAFERLVQGARPEETLELARRALADGALLAEESPDSPVYYLASWTLALADRMEESEAALQVALREARVRGSALGFTIASCFRSNVAYRMGSLLEAEANARAVLDVEPEHRWPLGVPFAVGFLLEALIERGDLDGAYNALEDIGFAHGDLPNLALSIFLLFGRGRLRLARGEVDDGIADLLLVGERSLAWGSRNPTFISWRSTAALALAEAGDTERPAALVAEEIELSRAAGAQRALGMALRAQGILEGSEGALAEAVSTHDACGARLEQARALTDLGALIRRSGRKTDAREPLRQALDLAHRCDATVLSARVLDELKAAGARPRRVALSGIEALTARERRVAGMAAEGMSNRDIAQALFVTLQTVEVHLTNAYRKLGVTSREDLPAAGLAPAR